MSGTGLVKRFPGLSTLIALEILTFLIVSYQIQFDERISLLEKMGLTLIGPVQGSLHALISQGTGIGAHFQSVSDLTQENRMLRQRLSQVEEERLAGIEAQLELRRLRKLIELPPTEGFDSVPAVVIGKANRNKDPMLFINKGSKDGLREDLGVRGVDGVVGVIWEVSPHYAKVMLVANPASAIAAIVQDSRYLESMVSGDGTLGKLENFPNFEALQPGSQVLASGLDGLFPKGLSIGTVAQAKPSAYMFQDVILNFNVDFSRLEEVLVLVPRNATNLNHPTEANHGMD